MIQICVGPWACHYVYTRSLWTVENGPVFRCNKSADGHGLKEGGQVLWLYRGSVNTRIGWVAAHAPADAQTLQEVRAGHRVFGVYGDHWLNNGGQLWIQNLAHPGDRDSWHAWAHLSSVTGAFDTRGYDRAKIYPTRCAEQSEQLEF